jgi:hypothetical protein
VASQARAYQRSPLEPWPAERASRRRLCFSSAATACAQVIFVPAATVRVKSGGTRSTYACPVASKCPRSWVQHPRDVARLLTELRAAGAGDAAQTLATRAAEHVSLDHPGAVAEMLEALRAVRAGDAVQTLATRAAEHAAVADPGAVAKLLAELRTAGAGDAERTLATRAANTGMFELFLEARPDDASIYRFGREADGAPSQPWKWQSRPAVRRRSARAAE